MRLVWFRREIIMKGGVCAIKKDLELATLIPSPLDLNFDLHPIS